MGGENPIESINDTVDTMIRRFGRADLENVAAGCEYVRITAPSIKEAQITGDKNELRKEFSVPLIADIHFTPNAAELPRGSSRSKGKSRNYADKKRFEQIDLFRIIVSG